MYQKEINCPPAPRALPHGPVPAIRSGERMMSSSYPTTVIGTKIIFTYCQCLIGFTNHPGFSSVKRHFITNEQIFDFFYNFEQGIIIISNSMEILSINKKAKNLIENSRSFRIMNGKIHHTSRIDDLTFERIIKKFIDDSRKSEQALVVKDHSTGGRLLVQLRKPDRERCDSMMMMIESDRECLVDPSPSLRRLSSS